jgi:RHS repeat-associated protein
MGKDDYYPFGLRMAGFSYNRGMPESHLKFSGKELDEEQGLKKYHFGWRDYDPELGRWNVVDPARQFASPYVFNGNTAINGYDPDGRFFDPVTWGIIIGAAIGAYGGGAYANNGELDPTKWDYQNGGTWAGMIGGGVLGGFAGGHMAFQMFGSATQGATGVTFMGSAYGTGGGFAAGANASVVVGGASSGTFSYGAFAAYTAGVGITAFAAYNVYNNGLGTPGNNNSTQWDFSYGAYYTYGGGSGSYLPNYGLNNNSRSGMNGNYWSASFGQMRTYNSATGQWTNQGMVGLRYGNASVWYHNDHEAIFGNTDQGWTGGITVSTFDPYSNTLGEWGFEDFTGIPGRINYNVGRYGTYEQTNYQMSLNKAATWFRTNNSPSTVYNKTAWLQDYIHDHISGSPRFIYNFYWPNY